MNIIPYPNRYLRIAATFIATIVVVFADRPFNLPLALATPRFYYAFASTFVVALLLITFVHQVTTAFDKLYDWRSHVTLRLGFQILFGIIAPAIIDVVVYSLYFLSLGINIIHTDFFKTDFVRAAILLLTLNIYYGLHYWFLTRKLKDLPVTEELPAGDEDIKLQSGNIINRAMIHVNYNGLQTRIELEEVFCIYASGKKIKVLTSFKTVYEFSNTMDNLELQCAATDLIRVSRGVIVNLWFVMGHEQVGKRDKLSLIIKPKYRDMLPADERIEYYVTKKYIAAFKLRFSAFQADL